MGDSKLLLENVRNAAAEKDSVIQSLKKEVDYVTRLLSDCRRQGEEDERQVSNALHRLVQEREATRTAEKERTRLVQALIAKRSDRAQSTVTKEDFERLRAEIKELQSRNEIQKENQRENIREKEKEKRREETEEEKIARLQVKYDALKQKYIQTALKLANK